MRSRHVLVGFARFHETFLINLTKNHKISQEEPLHFENMLAKPRGIRAHSKKDNVPKCFFRQYFENINKILLRIQHSENFLTVLQFFLGEKTNALIQGVY